MFTEKQYAIIETHKIEHVNGFDVYKRSRRNYCQAKPVVDFIVQTKSGFRQRFAKKWVALAFAKNPSSWNNLKKYA